MKMDVGSGTAQTEQEAGGDRRWYVLAIIVIGYAIYNLDKSIVSILIEPLKAEFALSDGQIGALTGIATSLPFALACLPVGMLADRRNRKRLLALLIAGWSSMTALGGFAVHSWHLFAARAGVGGFEAGYAPVSMSMLSDSFPRRQRATAMGIFSLGAPLGVFLGLAVGGLVAASHGWRAAMWVAGGPGLILALVIALTIREPARGRFDDLSERPEPARLSAALSHFWRNAVVFHVGWGMTCGAIMLAAISVWTPSLLIRVHDFDVRQAGLGAALVVGLCGALGAAIGGIISDRLGARKETLRMAMPIFGPLVSMLFILGACFVDDGILALILLGPAAFFGQFYIGAGYAAATSYTPVRMRGATMAVLLIAFNLISHNMGAMLVGTLSDVLRPEFGGRSIAIGMALTSIFSLFAALFFWRAMYVIGKGGKLD
ncbi:Sugar phosphate permease [Sphingobium faniae]|nr:Sugar phosphate permease [Sphingobium faniae]